MLTINKCEIFYTDSSQALQGDEGSVDQISIDKQAKEYFLQTNCGMEITDGEMPGGYEINSLYVSRFIFDIIVRRVKERGFKEAEYVR